MNAEMRVGCFLEVWRVGFAPENRVEWLCKFGKSVFTTAKHVGSFGSSDSVLTAAKRIRCL